MNALILPVSILIYWGFQTEMLLNLYSADFNSMKLRVCFSLSQDVQATITNSWHEFYFTMDSEKNKETPAQKLKP